MLPQRPLFGAGGLGEFGSGARERPAAASAFQEAVLSAQGTRQHAAHPAGVWGLSLEAAGWPGTRE